MVSSCYIRSHTFTDKAANVAKTGLDTADTANLHVPFKVREGERDSCNLSYLTPKVWKTSENKEGSITFSTGDIFLEGEYPETVIADRRLYVTYQQRFYDYLNKKMDNVFLITSVGSYTLIPHLRLGKDMSKTFHFPSFSMVAGDITVNIMRTDLKSSSREAQNWLDGQVFTDMEKYMPFH